MDPSVHTSYKFSLVQHNSLFKKMIPPQSLISARLCPRRVLPNSVFSIPQSPVMQGLLRWADATRSGASRRLSRFKAPNFLRLSRRNPTTTSHSREGQSHQSLGSSDRRLLRGERRVGSSREREWERAEEREGRKG